ncbi:MAG TPA: thioesterase family protein [Chthoniobacterales bacterium]|jgi:YbgC/YbaW family acyl-CoA thioester hydrolase
MASEIDRLYLSPHDILAPMDVARPRIATQVQVMFFDTDCGGVVHNIAYLRFVEIARTLLAEELGLGLSDMARSQRYPVVVKTEIDYRRPATLGDYLLVEGWLERVERVRFWCEFRIVRPRDEVRIADCRQMLALIQMPEGKILRLPDSWDQYRDHVSKFPDKSDSEDVG